MNYKIAINSTSVSSNAYSTRPNEKPSPTDEFFYPLRVDPDQSWYWSPNWQEMEAQAEADLREGHFYTFDDVEEFINFLDSDNE